MTAQVAFNLKFLLKSGRDGATPEFLQHPRTALGRAQRDGEPTREGGPSLLVHMVFLDACIGRLIGRQGRVREQLEKKLGCAIIIARHSEFVPSIKKYKARAIDVHAGWFTHLRGGVKEVMHAANVACKRCSVASRRRSNSCN